jgi:hypothetical protein
MVAEHTITIRDAEYAAGFVVEILPPPEGIGHDRECITHMQAFRYAAGLRMTMRWPVRDLSSGPPMTLGASRG